MVKVCGKETSALTVGSLIASIVLFLGSMIVIIIGGVTLYYAGDVENLPNFAVRNCTVSAVQVTTLTDCGVNGGDYGPPYYDEWIAVWKCQETGASIVENPFSSRISASSASRDQADYPIGASQAVMCNTVDPPVLYPNSDYTQATGCQVWSTCFFDVQMIQYMMANSESDRKRGFILLFTGIGLVGISLIFFFVYIASICRANTYSSLN